MTSPEHSVSLQTFGDLLRHGYELTGYCRGCGVHRDIELTKLSADRHYVGTRFKCRHCGAAVAITLSQIENSGNNSAYYAALEKWRTPE